MKYRTQSQFSQLVCETTELRLEHEFETAYLVHKTTNKILLNDDFYGDPTCGLIDSENNWAIVAGSHMTVWKPKSEQRFHTDTFRDIHAMRLSTDNKIKILTDPWAQFSGVWELNILNNTLIKISDFNKYQGKEYCEVIEW